MRVTEKFLDFAALMIQRRILYVYGALVIETGFRAFGPTTLINGRPVRPLVQI
jgi:hypothetical protein